ncbi:hypothetical protein C7I55_10845 [Sphingomonas deserti]|uniref:Uncharacterized protein n=1 Tax=Allosphingosinicella deserti TaxID=2116704 RepID=A0A2P7QS53_9SPHN|nr:hypothetical protein C7I55_10845 [Sphingomonas deserti]
MNSVDLPPEAFLTGRINENFFPPLGERSHDVGTFNLCGGQISGDTLIMRRDNFPFYVLVELVLIGDTRRFYRIVKGRIYNALVGSVHQVATKPPGLHFSRAVNVAHDRIRAPQTSLVCNPLHFVRQVFPVCRLISRIGIDQLDELRIVLKILDLQTDLLRVLGMAAIMNGVRKILSILKPV